MVCVPTTSLRILSSVTFLIAFSASPSIGQQPELKDLATQVSARLTDSKILPEQAGGAKRRVVVVPFVQNDETTELGADLAVEFASYLAGVSNTLEVVDATQVRFVAEESGFWSYDLATDTIACWLAEIHGAAYSVTGVIEQRSRTVRVTARGLPCVRRSRGFEERVDIDPSPELRNRLIRYNPFPAKPTSPPKQPPPTTSGAKIGAGGVGEPRCRRCEDPRYSQIAREKGTEGVVVLRLVVAPDGRAHSIRLHRGLPDGLNAQAIQAINRWQFEPARDASGNTVAVWVTVEVVFRLLKSPP